MTRLSTLAFLLAFFSCVHSQDLSPEQLQNYCDKLFVCVGSKLGEYDKKSFQDPDILHSEAKLLDFVCQEDKATATLSVLLEMDKGDGCFLARVILLTNLHYNDLTNTCTIDVETSTFDSLNCCNSKRV